MNTSKIKSIKIIENKSFLYDIEVNKTNCFFANNILVHNSSFTAFIRNGVFGISGRTINFKVPDDDIPYDALNTYWKVAKKLRLEEIMNEMMHTINIDKPYDYDNFAIQGELVGEGIQKNIYKLHGQTVCFYNMFDIETQEYFDYDLFLRIMGQYGLNTVPILDYNYELPETPNMLLEEADVTRTVFGNNPNQLIEGFVYVAKGNIPNNTKILRAPFNRLSFKAKSRTYDENKNK